MASQNEWVHVEKGIATVGITKRALEKLGEIVYVELPLTGKFVESGDEAAVIESTKAAIDFYTPLSGTVIAINEVLRENTLLLNKDPESEGWLFKLQVK